MKYKQWNRAASAPQARAAMEAAGVPPLAALTLCARGLDTPEKARAFLDAGRGQLLDPFLMKDMDRAAARVRRTSVLPQAKPRRRRNSLPPSI